MTSANPKILLMLSCMLLQACVSPSTGVGNTVNKIDSAETAKDSSLYSALGKQAGIAAIVDGLLAGIATDDRIVQHFRDTDIALFRQRLIEYLCLVTDGGCVYLGESMAESHQGLGITQAHFDALVGHLIHSMKQQSVPLGTRNALLKRLASKYQDISYR
jgi:hemoglobin